MISKGIWWDRHWPWPPDRHPFQVSEWILIRNCWDSGYGRQSAIPLKSFRSILIRRWLDTDFGHQRGIPLGLKWNRIKNWLDSSLGHQRGIPSKFKRNDEILTGRQRGIPLKSIKWSVIRHRGDTDFGHKREIPLCSKFQRGTDEILPRPPERDSFRVQMYFSKGMMRYWLAAREESLGVLNEFE